MKIFYKPAYFYLFVDCLLLTISMYVVLDWFPLTTATPFNKYIWPSFCYVVSWALFSYLLKRYKPLRQQRFFRTSFKLFYTSLIVFAFFSAIIYLYYENIFSEYVLFSITIVAFTVNYLALNIYFAYRYAVEYNEVTITKVEEERVNAKLRIAPPLDDESLTDLRTTIKKHSGKATLKFLSEKVALDSGNSFVFSSVDFEILKYQPHYHYSTFVQLEWLNNIRGINKMFAIANEKLPDEGVMVCCFESKSTYKKRILNRYPQLLNYIIYSLDFLLKRLVPKIFITRRLFYLLSGGRDRILSKTEVLGRLYCCGFKVLSVNKVGQLTYVLSQRVKHPDLSQKNNYGPLIRLRRHGKNGKVFKVYKIRTMHPYSEYIQAYIYESNSLKEGGKFNRDIRITTSGRFFRKYWIDELPMLLNLLKGEMKLVGVRPLSAHYLSLYSEELQKKRAKFKPGLLPPFYAHMPRTLPEIEASEMLYLNECESDGVLYTDLKYLGSILNNILFMRARSS
jgi:hypothetical protein